MRVTQRGRRSLDVGRTEVFRPRVVFAAAFALTVLDFADRQVVVATFPALRDEWALSDAQLGALVSVVSVTVGIGAFPAALLVDRWSRVRAIALMGMVWSLAAAAAGAAQSFGQLLTARAARDYPTVELGPATGARAAGGRTEELFRARSGSAGYIGSASSWWSSRRSTHGYERDRAGVLCPASRSPQLTLRE